MAARSERVLVMGASGFTGRPLVKQLRQDGHEVVAASHEADEPGALIVDLCDLDAVTEALSRVRPSAVVHLAGIAATTYNDVGKIYATNVVGTANLFAALSSAKIEPRIVIVASSAQIYAVSNTDAPLTEDSPVAPETHYAVSKRTTEDIARIYSHRIPIIVTRCFNYTGPGQSSAFLVPKIVRHYAEAKSEIRLGQLGRVSGFFRHPACCGCLFAARFKGDRSNHRQHLLGAGHPSLRYSENHGGHFRPRPENRDRHRHYCAVTSRV